MTSNQSSNKTVKPHGLSFILQMAWDTVKKNLWFTTLATLAFFFSMPVYSALYLQNSYPFNTRFWNEYAVKPSPEVYTNALNKFLGLDNYFLSTLLCLAAIVGAACFFSYLHNKRKVDLMHSLPLKRGELFAINYLAGIGAVLLPFLINLLLTFAVIAFSGFAGYLDVATMLANSGLHILFFITIYSFLIIPGILTGNTVLTLMLQAVFIFIGPACVGIYYTLMERFYSTFYGSVMHTEELLAHTSPVTRYYMAAQAIPLAGAELFIIPLFTALCVFIAYLLYKKRPSESAGKALAFKRSKPIIKYPILLLMTLGFGLFFDGIGGSLGWLFFGVVIGAFIWDRIIEIICAMDFRAIGKHYIQLGIFIVIVSLLLLIPIFDATGYDEYQPEAVNVQSIQVILNGNVYSYLTDNYDGSYYTTRSRELQRLKRTTLTEEASIDAMLSLVGKSIEHAKVEDYSSKYNYLQLNVFYTLNNGRQVGRIYHALPMNMAADELAVILDNQEYKDGNYEILSLATDNIFFEAAESWENNESNIYSGKTLYRDLQEEIIDAFRQDIARLDSQTLYTQLPIGRITFCLAKDDEYNTTSYKNIQIDSDGNYKNGNLLDFTYAIYPTYTATLKALADAGIPLAAWEKNPDKVNYITIESYSDRDDREVDDKYDDYYGYETRSSYVGPNPYEAKVGDEYSSLTIESANRDEINRLIDATFNYDAYADNPFIVPQYNQTIYCYYNDNYTSYNTVRYYPLYQMAK